MDSIKVQIIKARECGLEVYKVYVNGTLLSTHMSVQSANTKVLKLSNTWARF